MGTLKVPRNMIEANEKAFKLIHEHVLAFDPENFKEKKEKICIASDENEKLVLQHGEINEAYSIYGKYSYLEITIDNTRLLVIKGIGAHDIAHHDLDKFKYVECCAGLLTILLSEGFLKPLNSRENIFNLYDRILYDDKSQGLRKVSSEELFDYLEDFIVLEIMSQSLTAERAFGCFLLESYKALINNKIDLDLIKATFENGSELLPYKHIIKSLLHYNEPKHLFLELYKCLERLYALPAMEKLKINLKEAVGDEGICAFKLSQIVEKSIGWRQSEEDGLKMLLSKIENSEVDQALNYLNNTTINDGISDLALEQEVIEKSDEDFEYKSNATVELYKKKSNLISKRIYKCRNSFVHYREVHVEPYVDDNDIPDLCNLILLVLDPIYSEIKV